MYRKIIYSIVFVKRIQIWACLDLCNLVNCIIMMGIGLAYTFQILFFFFFSMGSANSSTNEVNICIPA